MLGSNPFVLQATNKEFKPEDFEIPPSGVFPGNLVAIVDIGTHRTLYNGKTTVNRKVAIIFELWNQVVRRSNGQSFFFSEEFNVPEKFAKTAKIRILAEKLIGRSLEDGERLDIGSILGIPCSLEIVHNGGTNSNGQAQTYANLESVGACPYGANPSPTVRPFVWHLDLMRQGVPFPQEEWLPKFYGRTPFDSFQESDEARAAMAQAHVQAHRPAQGYQQPQAAPQSNWQPPPGPYPPAAPQGYQQTPAAPQGYQQPRLPMPTPAGPPAPYQNGPQVPSIPQGYQQAPAAPQGYQQPQAAPQGYQQAPAAPYPPAAPQGYQQPAPTFHGVPVPPVATNIGMPSAPGAPANPGEAADDLPF